jgi:CRISPR-associated protein Cas1
MNLLNATLDDALTQERLLEAWAKVLLNAGSPGADGVTLQAFGRDVARRLRHLAREVKAGTWRPWPLLRVRLERPGKKPRYLAIPTVRDRVLHTALALTLTPILEKQFEACSYAYRVGHSLTQALARVQSLRDKGYRWVVDADISSYFDEVDHGRLLSELGRYVEDAPLLALVRTLLRAPVHSAEPGEGDYCLMRGIPQGSPLSPLMANLYLDTLDEALLGGGLALVRFADDFLVLCRDKEEAEDALDLTESVLAGLSLKMNPEKTRITHFDEGFHFLGAEFLRNAIKPPALGARGRMAPPPKEKSRAYRPAPRTTLAQAFLKVMRQAASGKAPASPAPGATAPDPSAPSVAAGLPAPAPDAAPQPADGESQPPLSARFTVPDQEEAEEPAGASEGAPVRFDPLLRTLYLHSPGLYLHREGERFLVRRDGQDIESLPGRKIALIVLHGNQALSTGVLEYCAENGIGVTFVSNRGGCYASLSPYADDRVELHRAQFLRDGEAAFHLAVARAIAQGKLANQRLILRRYRRRHPGPAVEEALAALDAALAQAGQAGDLDTLRGTEGSGAKAYFAGLAGLLPAHWAFAGRKRQPPTDPVNAMLSYGYAVLYSNMLTLVRRRGLNAHLGHLHSPHHGQPALVSDLVEEFRPLVVDAVVLRLLLSGDPAPEHFKLEEGMCRLSAHARSRLVGALEDKLNTALIHPLAGSRMDYRRAMQYQVQLYARVVLGEAAGQSHECWHRKPME